MLSFFPRGVLDESLNLIESGFEEFPSYSLFIYVFICFSFIVFGFRFHFCGFICVMFSAVQFLNVLILTLLSVEFI